eukprot:CAMPEP_0174898770 /NCGR_PEP_ID=MMETSP0167-20121228/23645_1 /TAXON_ID=38298 /ORGANISM="Rhodella maculata, Strain CCMP736" /LENGTH=255 /DNA_ID=CAMNT_0016139507 /DNA_START=13 /DNA_END=780 /DNA_ORIENTATION=-
MPRKFIVGGNWKCNGTLDSIKALAESFGPGGDLGDGVDVFCAPPTIYCAYAKSLVRPDFHIALQNCWIGKGGAFTGETSADMIKDMGLHYVILGHSERRHLPQIKESDETISAKCKYALEHGLTVIYCIGELLEERESGRTKEVNETQLSALAAKISPADWENIVIAYEPVWAIGTGKVATPAQAQEACKQIREWIAGNVSVDVAEATRIQYGGSVSSGNCEELAAMPDIDGFLVGGASLKPDFLKIVDSYKAAK